MIKAILAAITVLAMGFVGIGRTETTIQDLFKENEGKILDWAIASSVEVVYYRDFIHGNNGVGAQTPIFFLSKYISGDVGYISIYEAEQRGSVTVGASLRVDRILRDAFKDRIESLRVGLPEQQELLDRLYFGPWYSYHTTNNEHMGGIKAGFRIF